MITESVVLNNPDHTNLDHCIITLDPSGYFLMLIGATIGYSLTGYYLAAACFKTRENNNNIIIAETL